jgi:hypothetical protein
MKYIKTLVGSLVALAFLSVAAVQASADTNAVALTTTDTLSPWTFSISGGGNTKLANDSAYVDSTVGGTFDLGYSTKIVLPSQVGVRQSIGYSDASGATWNFDTKVYNDWTVFRVGNLELDGGGNIGASYGNQAYDWQVAPEAIARLYLKKDVDVFARVEYPYDITKGATENSLTYDIGLRVRF